MKDLIRSGSTAIVRDKFRERLAGKLALPSAPKRSITQSRLRIALLRSCRSPKPQIVTGKLVDRCASHEFHVALQFSPHQAERSLDASLPCRRQGA